MSVLYHCDFLSRIPKMPQDIDYHLMKVLNEMLNR